GCYLFEPTPSFRPACFQGEDPSSDRRPGQQDVCQTRQGDPRIGQSARSRRSVTSGGPQRKLVSGLAPARRIDPSEAERKTDQTVAAGTGGGTSGHSGRGSPRDDRHAPSPSRSEPTGEGCPTSSSDA